MLKQAEKFVADQIAIETAAAKSKAKAEAKTSTEATSKKTTITCVKGKTVKKITAVKPVCPKGYKKK